MIKVGIIGASGYTGGELLRFLYNHPQVEVVAATSRQYNEMPIYKVHPHIRDCDLSFQDTAPSDIDADLVFTATPHGASMKIVPDILERGIKVIDLSGDYRFDNIATYEKWYGLTHDNPLDAVYGLPEIYRDEIKKASFVANPGCFPTGAILACMPIASEKLTDAFIIDSKTGVSGAGIKPTTATHFPNCSDNIVPYNVTTHRHMPEIEQEINKFSSAKVCFTPHLVPVIRGILTTVHVFLKEDLTSESLEKIYNKFYHGEPFVKVLDDGEIPRLSAVRGSNYAHVGCFQVDHNGRVVIVSAIDNLVKGASGQAIHNMNLMFGFNEKESLDVYGIHP
ncbi:N-acetyl-gamma-glutamyl-phosphate reductase [Methanobacterium alcaliphilum]|uniref:N-acetyl-gamma-glutamyl-phosphate reductase n=1 Tax=Methanobacterium alcaliphilum TaxID=392018 RepID=UPI002009E826|nr:N-acetyl-gamma-glutamyl-phosphate reductase [Methanobacterium alcaliphilum]MCK9150911.1 N-acetyl-gamma-glutamyl-phosphate reductase [Methanobacterium alcaliphilum]